MLYALLLVAMFVYMSIWFGFAFLVKRIDAVDSAWGLGFVYVALIVLFSDHLPAAARAAAILTGVWGLRLSWHITQRNRRTTEDKRYAVYRKKWGDNFWSKAYTNIYLLQGLLILLVSTPLVAIESRMGKTWNALMWTGFGVWVFGILFEAIADYQLRRFRATVRTHKVLQTGLWHYSRHPNYFGEIMTWLGAALVAGGLGQWWGFVGPVVIAFLITQVSGIPPLEKRYAHDKTYQDYARRTSILIPWFPRTER